VGNLQTKWEFADHSSTGKRKWLEKKLKDSLLEQRQQMRSQVKRREALCTIFIAQQ
jgi:hypothetical protein